MLKTTDSLAFCMPGCEPILVIHLDPRDCQRFGAGSERLPPATAEAERTCCYHSPQLQGQPGGWNTGTHCHAHSGDMRGFTMVEHRWFIVSGADPIPPRLRMQVFNCKPAVATLHRETRHI